MLGKSENRPDPFVVPPLGGKELRKGGFLGGNDDDKPPKGGTTNQDACSVNREEWHPFTY